MSEIMEKEHQFIDWESRVFGAGYGTGELPIMKSLKLFFDCFEDGQYDYEILEKKLGDTVAWLLINALDKGNVLEWGTSSRYGWLTSCGENVRDFIKDKSPEELYEILMSDHDDICLCDGGLKGHEDCWKNPMVNKEYADNLKYSSK